MRSTYAYDNNGNRTEMVTSEGTTTYTYNENNQLESLTTSSGTTSYDYDALGNQTRVDYPNGTYTQYTYAPYRNWLTSLINRNSGGTVLSSFDYTYDNIGNRLTVTEHDGSVVSYDYDDIYELESETRTGSSAYSNSYTYDGVGNRLTMTKDSITTDYTYNDNNQLITETIDSDTTTLYTYDDNGNLLLKTDGTNTTLYTWDWRNMLTSVSDSSDTTTYAYDGDGNRISKTADEVKTKYINDVASPLVQVLFETTDEDTVLASYVYGNDLISVFRPLFSENCYYHYDGLGSTRQLTDDTEAVVASYTYDAFGNVIASSGATTNAYGFTGEQQFNEADNLVFLRARYYDSRIGRFISRDPIGYRGGINLYVYCLNNSVNYIDLKGYRGCFCNPIGGRDPTPQEQQRINEALNRIRNMPTKPECVQEGISFMDELYGNNWPIRVCNSGIGYGCYDAGMIYIRADSLNYPVSPLGGLMCHELCHAGGTKNEQECQDVQDECGGAL